MELTLQFLSRLEVGQQSASVDTLARLADSLKVELWELFDFGHHATPNELRGILRKLVQGYCQLNRLQAQWNGFIEQ